MYFDKSSIPFVVDHASYLPLQVDEYVMEDDNRYDFVEWVGIDVTRESVGDIVRRCDPVMHPAHADGVVGLGEQFVWNPVLEPAGLAKCIVRNACETAEVIVRCDEVIVLPPKVTSVGPSK